jgi:alkylation response protein AidB-like acyl-CoA dehydrogenase
MSTFVQPAPRLANTYDADPLLPALLRRKWGAELHRALEPELRELGERAAGPLHDLQRADRLNEPVLTQWDAWGARVDRIEVSPLWREAERLAALYGLVAIPYERREGRWSRLRQFALAYLFHPVTDVYTCPLAMTDGAARTLLASGNEALIARAVPHLTSRDPASFWTSGQWMTESTGGSDVGRSETVARPAVDGTWRLHGRKWFTSAAASQIALVLARPEGNGPGGSGLALYYVECRDAAGRLSGIRVDRLKDKLGTRKVPTAELTLDGTAAVLVGGLTGGTRAIEPMLRITRTWNSIAAVAFMRHALQLAEDYARRRVAFGAPLAEQPLHADTLEDLQAETAGATLLAFLLVELLGGDEDGALDADDAALLRLLFPVTKLTTGRQAVQVVQEALEAFGGAGYVEDTGLPVLLRDTLVLPIWEGTTNVLSLDALLRADLATALPVLRARIAAIAASVPGDLVAPATRSLAAIDAAAAWVKGARDVAELQAGARRCALTLGRALELALLVEHAASLSEQAARARAVGWCRRFAAAGVELVRHPTGEGR